MFHKYTVPLISVSIFWFSPGVEFSLRILKSCACPFISQKFTSLTSPYQYMWYNSVSIWFVSKHTLPVPYCNCVCFAFSIILKNLFQYIIKFSPRPLHNPMLELSNTTGSASNLRSVILSLHTILLPTFFTALLCPTIATTLSTLPPPEHKLYNCHFSFHLALATSLHWHLEQTLCSSASRFSLICLLDSKSLHFIFHSRNCDVPSASVCSRFLL